jgi:outer membrane murein-binding lipoprotein Lpp
MSSRKLNELATDIDDAKTTVDELQDDADTNRDEKLDDLQKTLEHASDATDDLANEEEDT